MGKTKKDNREFQKRKIIKAWNKRSSELGLRNDPYSADHNAEMRQFKDKFEKLRLTTMDGWKSDRRHSAAHRHSAIKTTRRLGRIDKHAKNRDELKLALEE